MNELVVTQLVGLISLPMYIVYDTILVTVVGIVNVTSYAGGEADVSKVYRHVKFSFIFVPGEVTTVYE